MATIQLTSNPSDLKKRIQETEKRSKMKSALYRITERAYFVSCCSLIFATSTFDAYLAYYYRATILALEKNPICLLLMRLEPNHLSVFLLSKFVGTLIALTLLTLIFRFRKRLGHAIAGVLSLFQIGLISYQLLC